MITKSMVTETELHTFVTEASDLGWPPGEWPNKVETDMGNGRPFLLWSATQDYRLYRQSNGIIVLRVLND
jgi:hypothetical protein